MLKTIRNAVGKVSRAIWTAIAAVVVLAILMAIASRGGSGVDPRVLEMTISAVSTQANRFVPTLAAELTQTPSALALTGAAPTLELAGRREVRQYAASAAATSERGDLEWGAVQAAGPPNTTECGDARTAWASEQPNEAASLTLLFPELVTPTGLLVYETYNPGFITLITFTDIYGEEHIVYQATPQLRFQCPFVLVVPIMDADYQGNRVTIFVNQATSVGGWDQIDAVELVGIKH